MSSSDEEATFQEAFWMPLTGGENPILTLMLGLCPTMAVTTDLKNGFFMGLGVVFVLFTSNLVVSLIRNVIPKEVRIPAFITVIATSVSIVDMTMAATIPDIHEKMGIFIALIVEKVLQPPSSASSAKASRVPDVGGGPSTSILRLGSDGSISLHSL